MTVRKSQQPLKILQVNKLYYPEVGGIEKTLQQLSEGLSAYPDIELEVLVCQRKGRKQEEEINGVRVTRSGSLGVLSSVPISPFFMSELRKKAADKDVIQFHLPFPLGDLGCLLSGYKGKVAVYWHSDVVKQKKWMIFYRPVMELFLKRADVIMVGAKGILEGSSYLRPYKKKCRIVPFAVSNKILAESRAYLEQKKQHKKEKEGESYLHFLFIGRLVYYKGCSALLAAFAASGLQARLTIIGDGPLLPELQAQVKQLEIQHQVLFLGSVKNAELQAQLKKADVFVLPSIEKSEAFGLVQLEAMAYGIPVINTHLPSGVPEVSIHGKTGLTVEPGDVNALAEAMLWMAEHENERKAFGITARRRVEEHFTEQIMVEHVRRIYEMICHKKDKI